MTTRVAIRLGVEGGADLRRELQEAGRAGQSAFGDIEQAANKAAGAADQLGDKARQAGQAGQSGPASRPPAAPPAPPPPPPAPVKPSPAALREAERVRYRLDTDARNTIQLDRDRASIDRAERAGIHSEAESKRLRDLADRKYGGGANDNDGARRGLDSNQRKDILYQGGDIIASLGSGSGLGTVAFQQGPQVLQGLATGEGGLRGGLKALGQSALGLVTPMSVAGTAVAALGTAFVVASSQAGTERDALEKSVQGIGRATGATVGQLEMLSRASAAASKESTSTAREIVAALASSGDISLPAIDSVSRSTSDFAKATGSDIQTATATLAAAFSDPAKGADQLAKAIGGLDDKTRQLIRTQEEQGNKAGAQATMAAYLDQTLKDNTRSVEGLAAGWEAATTKAAQYYDRFKRRAGQITGSAPETAEEALARLDDRIAKANEIRAFSGRAPLGLGDSLVRDRDAAALIADTQRREAQAKAAEEAANRTSLTAGELARSLDPVGQQLRALEAMSVKLQAALGNPLARSKLGDDLPQVEQAFARVARQIADMKRDMDDFGTTAVANLNRAADFALKTVGYTPTGRAAAEAARLYEERLGARQIPAAGPSSAEVEARYAARFNAPGVNFQDLYRIAKERDADADMKAALEREGYQSVRDKELERIRRESSASENRRGGAYSRLTPEVRAQVDAGAARFPRIPASYLAALAEIESKSNLDVGYTKVLDEDGKKGTAYGLGQITRTTGNELFRRHGIDRMNRATMGEAMAGVLDMKLDAVGGDLDRAIMAYRGSRTPGVNLSYLAEAKRKAGDMGDLSVAGLAREQDARTRGLRVEAQTLEIVTAAGGRNREGTAAMVEAMKAEEDARARGIDVTKDYAAQLLKDAQQRQSILSDTRLQQYLQDIDFQREQLGRSPGEARGASIARSMNFDLDSPKGQAVMEAERLNETLRNTKSVANEAARGLLSDLRRSNDVAGAVGNTVSRIADRFSEGVLSSAIDGLFAGEGKKGGGGWISSLMTSIQSGIGGAADGYVPRFADGRTPSVSAAGIVSGPGGPRDDSILAWVSNREAIIKASSVERYGPNLIRSINEGTAPREIAAFARDGGRGSVLARFADGRVPVLPGREAFTTPRNAARATGGGSGSNSVVKLEVINENGSSIRTREVPDGRGGRKQQMVVGDAWVTGIGTPQAQQAMASGYGLKPRLNER